MCEQKSSSRSLPSGRHFLFICAIVTACAVPAFALFGSASGSFILFLPLVLLGVLSVGREFLTPSLKELAFYFSALIAAAVLIWPGAHWAAAAYQASGIVTLAAFMIVAVAWAIALGLNSARLLAGGEGEE